MTRWTAHAEPFVDRSVAQAVAGLPASARMVGLGQADLVSYRALAASATADSDTQLARSFGVQVARLAVDALRPSRQVSMLVVRPARPASDGGPTVVFLHGGGQIAGSSRTGIERVLPWVTQAGATVVSVEYRLAPEHPFPAGLDDACAALWWLSSASADLEWNLGRLVLAGASGGAALAAAAAIRVRDDGGPELSNLMLLCPMLDDRNGGGSKSFIGVPWDTVSNATAWNFILGPAAGGDGVDAAAAPARAESLAGLPPTFLDVGGADVFRDETIAFATRLVQAGVPTELHLWAGGTHSFDSYAADAVVSQAARAVQLSYVRRIANGDLDQRTR